MKQSFFIGALLIIAVSVSVLIYVFIFGAEGDAYGLRFIYLGGFLVPILMSLLIMVVTFIVERYLSLRRANGKGPITMFLKNMEKSLMDGKVDGAIDICNKQRGSCANVIRSGLERYKQIAGDSKLAAEKQMAEVQRAIEEAMMLETPLLEKNLIALSTIASISTMIGLLGAVIGMIRSFGALGAQGAVDAAQLSIGISEALINTAIGLIVAITGIVSYNYFVNKVDSFTYMIDEATFNVIQILTSRSK
ncbi:MAG: MotA/TolQ/ExbB proton channel family protein [Bacteroidota bacterium]